MENTSIVIGTAGMILILLAFVLDLLNKLDDDTKLYNLMNLAGAALLFYYAYYLFSLPFMILQSVWAGFAGYKLIKISTGRQHLKNKK